MEEVTNLIRNKLNSLDIISHKYLDLYILFCKEKDLISRFPNTSLHHILPAKIFPQYKDLLYNKWNGSYLSFKDHYIAHAILSLAINHPSIIGAWWGMNNKDKHKGINGLNILGPEKYNILFSRSQKAQSIRMKNKVLCRTKESPSEFIIVDKEEFYNNRYLYLGSTEGKLSVINKITNEKIFINSSDYNKDIHLFHRTNKKRTKESIEAGILTKKVIGNDGLNISQRAGKKAYLTHVSKLTQEEYKTYCKNNSFYGRDNNNYNKVLMTNDLGITSIRLNKS